MKALLISCMLLNGVIDVSPQADSRACLHPSASIVRVIQSDMFRFPDFVDGHVYFTNGSKRTAKLNYNYRHGQVQFIGLLADTLLVTGKALIDRVEFAGKVFFLTDEQGDMEAIARFGNVYLAERVLPRPVGDGRNHSGLRYSASAGNVPSSLLINNQGGNFQWENNSLSQSWAIGSVFFLVDANRVARPASRRSFLTVYGRHRGQLARYLRSNKVDFKNAGDLRRLLAYCENLTTR